MRNITCYIHCHSLGGVTFSQIDSNKLSFHVENEMTLFFCQIFLPDLINMYNLISCETKRTRFGLSRIGPPQS